MKIKDKQKDSVIKWIIDHDYGYHSYLLIGEYKEKTFFKPVLDMFWGIPLIYAKWCIKMRFLALYGNVT